MNQPASNKPKHPLEYAILVFVIATAIATASAAYYTRQQWLAAQDSAERQVRAYAFPAPAGIRDFEIGKAPIGGIVVRSMGQTPAYKVRGEISTGGMAYPPKSDDLTTNGLHQIQNSAFVGPMNVFSLEVPTRGILNQSIFDAINDGKTYRLYVWGRVDYTDVFKRPHWFTFCYSYDGASIKENQNVETCAIYNDADND